MTRDEAMQGMMRLQASYPNMQKLDAGTVVAYVAEIGMLSWEDFSAAATTVVRTCKFFPSIAEILDAANAAAIVRFQAIDREERLAIQGESAIMDPKSEIHREPIGPNHRIFLEYLNGTRTFPEPEWMQKRKPAASPKVAA